MTQTTIDADQRREDKPPCFGNPEHWDPRGEKDVICCGGLDPTFRHPTNGSQVRDACGYFDACGARVQASRLEAAQARLVDPKSLLNRPGAGGFARGFSSAYAPSLARPVLEPARTAAAVVPKPAPPQVQVHHQQYPPASSYLPPFLSVPEPRGDDSFVSFLWRTALRAALKACGHALAYVFDTHPLKPPTQPPGQ